MKKETIKLLTVARVTSSKLTSNIMEVKVKTVLVNHFQRRSTSYNEHDLRVNVNFEKRNVVRLITNPDRTKRRSGTQRH